MASIYFSGDGFVGHMHVDDHYVNLAPYGARVWCAFSKRFGPTFYRGEHSDMPISKPSAKTWNAFSEWYKEIQNSC